MQPYLFPYVGYFQLISSADVFVVYDNIQYTKKGWVNRNRILVNGSDAYITAPLRKDSDYLDIRDRELSAEFDRRALLNRLRGAYLRAPHFSETMEVVAGIVDHNEDNLFGYLEHSIRALCDHLAIGTRIVRSSELAADHTLRGQARVIDICRSLGADAYVNAVGGRDLYSHDEFRAAGLELSFIESAPLVYDQFGAEFVPWLSIIDVLMFNDLDTVRAVVAEGYVLT